VDSLIDSFIFGTIGMLPPQLFGLALIQEDYFRLLPSSLAGPAGAGHTRAEKIDQIGFRHAILPI
jgi:hypothetical protein